MKQTLDHPTEGTVSLVAGGFQMSETPLTIRTPAPSLGQHNDELFGTPAKSASRKK